MIQKNWTVRLKATTFWKIWKSLKKYFDTIKINIKEAVSSVVWLNGNKAYYLDLQGEIISPVNLSNLDKIDDKENTVEVLRNKAFELNLPVIINQNNITARVGEQIISADIIDYIIKLNTLLDKAGIAISYYQLNPQDNKEITVKALVGYLIYFSRGLDVANQVNNLKVFLEEKVSDQHKIEYIDMRLGNKIFYK